VNSSMRNIGMEYEEIRTALAGINDRQCDPPLKEKEVAKIAASAARYLPGNRHAPPSEHRPAIEAPWPESLSPDAYHGLAGEIARAIEPHTESHPAAILVQLLIAFGNCVGTRPYFYVEGSRHTANLFTTLVGSTGKSRKGTSWALITQLFRLLNDPWAENCLQSGLSSGEGLI
jgi:hypothetical protein